mmetsp:Transcript_10147/g.25048  ORF Transcript_10147/g.25048 Transcript_10147/m.25048 type:complete len:460 (+) Transcript_10147:198-1577(+)
MAPSRARPAASLLASLAVLASCSAFNLPSSPLGFSARPLQHAARLSPPRPASHPSPAARRTGARGLCAQIKFADAVEEVLKRKYVKKNRVPRVIKSWRRMDEDFLYRAEVPEYETVQECNSYIEGLKPRPFHDPYQFEWAQKLRDSAEIVQEEFKRVACDGEDSLYEQGNNVWVTAANSTSAESYGPDWKTLALMDRCVWDQTNVKLFPKTTKLLRDLEVPCIEAFFARMMPNSVIKPHSDYCNFALTSHLGLDVPEGQCWIEVGNERREWRNGEMLLFDTSLMHKAANEADQKRFILMLRVWHPDLNPSEVDAIKYIFDCLDEPEIIERDIRLLAPELLGMPAMKKPSGMHFGADEGGRRLQAKAKAKKDTAKAKDAKKAAKKEDAKEGDAEAADGEGGEGAEEEAEDKGKAPEPYEVPRAGRYFLHDDRRGGDDDEGEEEEEESLVSGKDSARREYV